ncbi:hypothetical protein ABE504_20555 [Paenibacillus oryzisoli]|uniref:prenylated flavin chaperone LpdD n=1 Tax=Paenibacillus oryzisoli TaxID=1850517 RepID=UPI003D2AB7E2
MERQLGLDYHIDIQLYPMGHDWVFLISGGRAHIGAVATAYPAKKEMLMQTVTIPGHREDRLATEIAEVAASLLNRTVTVVMGIHLEDATKKEIADIVEGVQQRMKETIANMRQTS